MSFGVRVDIRLDSLKHNLELLRSAQPDSKVLAAVKANAYGHGLASVSRTISDSVDALAVARMAEAARLRLAGIPAPVVLMGGVIDDDELGEAVELACDLVVHEIEQVDLLERLSGRRVSRVWLKVNTGMNRLGVRPKDVRRLVERLKSITGIGALGLMTHLANADNLDDKASLVQIEAFRAVTDGFDGDVSIANSAALLGWNDRVRDAAYWNNRGDLWIRPGISLYGISPLRSHSAAQLGLRPVMQLESVLIAVHDVPAGEKIGYGGTWVAGHDTRVGVVAAGYGDGYPRSLPSGSPVLVGDRRVPVVGVISMDLTVVDLGIDATERPGERVVLWGERLPVEEVAGRAGTVPYTLVCGVIDRTGRVA